MERFFLELLNRAICAGWLVPVILLLRLVLRKMPKWMRCLLWGMVAVRLLVPIQIESAVSLIPSAQTVSPDMMAAEKPEIHSGIGVINATVNPVISDYFAPEPENSVNPMQVLTIIASRIWLTGAVLLLLYAVVSYVRLRLLVRTAVPMLAAVRVMSAGSVAAEESQFVSASAGNVMPPESVSVEQEALTAASYRVRPRNRKIPVLESEHVDSPFVLGFIRPRIYLPAGVGGENRNYIISHELAHIRRKDHWIKPFGYILLAVYWFWPPLWAAYILLCRDIEYACDERVVKRYDVEERKAYSTALLSCSVRRFRIAACPVAFGEVGVRHRIKDVLHYKKPAFWVLLAAVCCCAAVAVCFLTNPKTVRSDAGDLTQGADGGNGADSGSGTGNGGGTDSGNGADSGDGTNSGSGTGNGGGTDGGNGADSGSGTGDGSGTAGGDGSSDSKEADSGNAAAWATVSGGQEADALDEAVRAAAWNWAEETGAFGGVSRTEPSAEGVTGELKATWPCVSYVVLAAEDSVGAAAGQEKTVTVYAHVLATAYLCENTGITELGGSYVPAAITFLIGADGSYTLSEYWTPREGSYYEPDIRGRFPGALADEALDGQRYIYALIQRSYAEAVRETGVVDTQYVLRSLFQKMIEDPEGLLDEGAGAAERMAAYPLTARELCYYGESTLRYIYLRFMNGGENGLEGELMAHVMNQLIAEEIQLRMPLDDGQAYFDALCGVVQDTYEELARSQGGAEEAKRYLREHMPAQYLLFLMLEQRTSDAGAEEQNPEDGDTVRNPDSADRVYEYYLTKEELLADIERGYVFRLDTTFGKPETSHVFEGTAYLAPYVRGGSWPFYVHEDNTVNLEIAFSELCRKPKASVFPGEEQILVEVLSPEGISVYRFEKTGEEITEDASVAEQIAVTPGEWTLQVSFAYVCGDTPAHLRIAAAYEAPSGEDTDWLKEERLNRTGI